MMCVSVKVASAAKVISSMSKALLNISSKINCKKKKILALTTYKYIANISHN